MSFSHFYNNQGFIRTQSFRSVLKYVFLLIVSITLFTQNGSRIVTIKSQPGVQLRAAIPGHCEFTAVEMELEEDESFSNTSQEADAAISSHCKSSISSYDAILKTKLLQLLSSFEKQPSSPLFVLHHSWKYSIA